jgi:hypothetical protein
MDKHFTTERLIPGNQLIMKHGFHGYGELKIVNTLKIQPFLGNYNMIVVTKEVMEMQDMLTSIPAA